MEMEDVFFEKQRENGKSVCLACFIVLTRHVSYKIQTDSTYIVTFVI